MKRIVSCEFNMDTSCVGTKYDDGSMIAINCTAVENQIAENMYRRAEFDWLIYNTPYAYTDLILNRDIETCLKVKTRTKASGATKHGGSLFLFTSCKLRVIITYHIRHERC